MNNPEIRDAIKFWGLISLTLFFCVYIGKTFAQTGSVWIPIFFFGIGVAAVTFYSPKTALGLIVFSMLLSPKVPGMQISAASYHNTVIVRFDDVLLGIVFLAWLARTAIFKQGSFLVSTPVHMPIFLYASACVLSTALGIMGGRLAWIRSSFYVIKYLEYFLLYFMTVNIVKDRDDIKRYLWYGLITAFIVTLYGYYQIPSGERVTAPFEAPLGASEIEKAQASEPNTLGGYYVVVFSLLLSFYTQNASSVPAMACFIFMILPFYYTFSRSSYLGLAASVISHMLLTQRRRLALAFGISCSGVLFLMVPKLREAVVNRIVYTFTGQEGSSSHNVVYTVGSIGGNSVQLEGSAAARYFSWKRIVLTQFPKHPIFGWGVTGVGLSDTQYPLVIGETGLVGTTIFFWMLFRIWKCARTVFRLSADSFDRSLALAVMTSLVGLLFHSLGANTFIIVRIMEPFWFLVAVVARLYIDMPPAERRTV